MDNAQSARQQFEKFILDLHDLSTMSQRSRDAKEAGLFQTMRSALKFARKHEAIIDGFSQLDRATALAFIHGRGIKKKVLSNQAKESLKLLLECNAWLRAAVSNDDLRSNLRDFFAGHAELEAKLERPPARFTCGEHDMSSGEEDTCSSNQPQRAEKPWASDEHVKKLIIASVDAMMSLNWEFPADPRTVGFDTATGALRLMYDGLTMLARLRKRNDLACQKVLSELDIDWVGTLRFLSTMYSSRNRSTLRDRITNVVEKLSRWVPAFQTAVALSPLGEHTSSPHAKAPQSAAELSGSISSEVAAASDRQAGSDGDRHCDSEADVRVPAAAGLAHKLVLPLNCLSGLHQHGKYAVQNCTERELVCYVEETATEFRLRPADLEVFEAARHESVTLRIEKKAHQRSSWISFFGCTSLGTRRLGEASLQHMAVHTVVAPSGRADDGVQCIMVA